MKSKKKYSDLKLRINKQDTEIRELKEIIKEKENEIETERIAKKRLVLAEKKRVKEKGDKIVKMKKEIDLKNTEIQSLKNTNKNIRDNKRLYSPKPSNSTLKVHKRNTSDKKSTYGYMSMNLESPKNNFNSTQKFEESDSIWQSSKLTTKRLKSSSPNRSKIFRSSKKISSGNVSRKTSSKMLLNSTLDVMRNAEHEGTCNKYCEACKYKKWRVNQLNYDPDQLVQNRDIIRFVTCLG